MGLYTDHWNRYKRDSIRGVVRLLVLIGVGLPATALIAVVVQRLSGSYPIWLHLPLLVIWLVAFTVLAVRHSRVVCPCCGTRYARGRGLCNCPSCDLRMLQDDP